MTRTILVLMVCLACVWLPACGDAATGAPVTDTTPSSDAEPSDVTVSGEVQEDAPSTPPPAVDTALDAEVEDGPMDVPPGPEEDVVAPSDLAAAYFDPDRVLAVEIELAPEHWEALRSETRTVADILGGDCLSTPPDQLFSWFPATVTVDGVTVTEAGIRKKGYLGSMSYEKPSLKVRFDKYVDQVLEDAVGNALQRLTLNNVQQDRSKLNTCMSYHVFALAGRPAPRCGFATVSVNGQAMGMYVHVESIKKDFIAQHFADAEGNLYEGTLSDFRPVWKNTFDKKTNASAADWSDVDGVTDALADPSPAGLTALAELVDIDQFLTHWALEVLVGHWDGYAGNRNNFYLYGEPGGRLVFIPWGPDSSFSPLDHPFTEIDDPQSVVANAGISHRLYQDPEMRAAYVERMKELLDTVWNEEALLAEVDRMAAIVQEHAHPDVVGWASWDTDRVKDFVTDRRADVLADLEPTPAQWPWPLAEPNICWEVLGTIDVSFETTWGTQGAENFMDFGSAQIAVYSVGGDDLTFVDAAVTSGMEGETAVISTIHVNAAGGFDVLSLYLAVEQVVPGEVAFDGWTPPGHRILFAPPMYEPDYRGRIDSGGVYLEQASTASGALVSGRVYGTIYGYGGYVSGTGSSGDVTADVGLVLNEIGSKGDPLDWFELHNTTGSAIDLSTYLVADDLTDATKRVAFPAGTTIEPGAYLVVELDKEGWPGFALGGDEELGIWTADGVLVDSADWANGFSGEGGTYARIPDTTGPFLAGQLATPGAPNDG